jgi:hypothetical protein
VRHDVDLANETFPTPQLRHESATGTFEYVSAGQKAHFVLPNVAIEPLRHGAHLVAPAAEIVPTAHGKHASPIPNWPAGQTAAKTTVKVAGTLLSGDPIHQE